MTALDVTDLHVSTVDDTPVLRGVSYSIEPGEILALVGESGSGKTTAGLAALGHFRTGLKAVSGSVLASSCGGAPSDVLALPEKQRRALRGRVISYIPQDPALSLNHSLRIGKQIAEVLEVHGYPGSVEDRVRETLTEVGLPSDTEYQRRYPHQLSGGQQQRVGIAMAFAWKPSVVVLDEPTTGLDVTTQALILETVAKLAAEQDTAALYITHDLAVVAQIAHRVAVMYSGEIVESGAARQVLHEPQHSYTRALMAAVPGIEGPVGRSEAEEPDEDVVLRAERIEVSYADTKVLRGVDLAVRRGESVLLLGESGSGKTTLSRSLCGLIEKCTGTVTLDGNPLSASARKRSCEQLRDVQYVFQSPFSSLNPRRTIAESVEVPLRQLTDLDKDQRRKRVAEVLEQVRLDPEYADRLPGGLSGGQRQRAAIARALVTTPKVLVCDEVTSALDVSVQATILELLGELRTELGMSILFVTHNIALARHVADRIAVLREGLIVEQGTVDRVLDAPEHEYTRELLANTPKL
ncbi:dipeptide ABC transporter ATP-binding protein [Sciscionella marina]|uniref:dipeptide ABC transporter ATP-binding protein n=1 Tax=Sciscionella marina TaxID=508770 RepID=UPI00038063DF